MPPPSVPISHVSRPRYTSQEFNTPESAWVPNSKIDIPGKTTRSIPARNAGFKPIGKVNSSLKKFFPGDEEDLDFASEKSHLITNTIADNAHTSFRPSDWDSPQRPVSRGWASPEPSVGRVWGSPQPSVGRGWCSPNPSITRGWGSPQRLVDNGDWSVSNRTGPWDSPPSSTSQVPRGPVQHRIPVQLAAEEFRVDGLSHSNLHLSASFHQPTRLPDREDSRPIDIPPTLESSLPLNNNEGRQSPRLDIASRTPVEISPSPLDNPESSGGVGPQSSNKDLYKIVSQVGEGTFGKVYKACNTISGAHVALKRIRMESERDGFPVTAMREIKLLQSLRHDNVVRLYEMMVSNGSVYMVFEYMDHDLTGVLSQNQFVFQDEHLKSLCHQMLAGLAYLHRKGVIHRDIKGSNILINSRGELKLADFGLARFYQKRRRADYTNRVITLWYRPPELLFGATVYGPEVDMWSAGCIMLELFTKKPVFQGADEINQLEVIFKILGTPTPERWGDAANLPWYELVKPQQALPSRFREAFQRWMSPAALDLAEQLLTYDPMQRITASQAMDSAYFLEEQPGAAPPIGLVDLDGEWHELETKRERAKRKERKMT
ncbi:hypothetical protein GALMADRAFT_205611 [Galerina marginata CBS 339.88]|uniref:[RNA-polymerase]-subunit kinase n=1 Tax=Galerina marginata (strain CBS 339.88) TaxID=685588 RepID=A0A067TKL1_GALM3|nr:hypothetical protein GALMADRAFT_205611 [Galerina marginata CBS 339.88]